MKNSMIAHRVSSAQFIFLLLFAAGTFNFPPSAGGRALISDDVKHDTPGQPVRPNEGVHVEVNLALVNVTVTDLYNRIVTGLEPGNFRVFEDNIEQEVVNFSCKDVPISIGVILDLSGSMAYKIGKAKEAALQFFKTASPEDESFLVGFSKRAQLLSPFTNNIEDLQSRLLPASCKGPDRLTRCRLSGTQSDAQRSFRQTSTADHFRRWR